MNILYSMQRAKFVEVNGRTYVAGYRCLPDEVALVNADIVLEAATEDSEIELTFAEVRDADQIGPDAYRLRSGAVLYFFAPPTFH